MQSSKPTPRAASSIAAVAGERSAPGARDRPDRPRELASAALFGTANEVLIRHDDTLYRLRKTGQGKLILTK